MLSMKQRTHLVLPPLMVLMSIAEDLLFKQTVLMILSTLFFLSRLIHHRTNRWTSSSEAILIYLSMLVSLLVVLPYFGIHQNRTSIMMILYLVLFGTAVCSMYTANKIGHDDKGIPLAVGLIGSAFLLILIARSIQLNGSVYPWAMSGDSRNHLYVVRQTVSSGRVKIIDSYPAFGNALVGVMSGWRIDENSAKLGKLAYEIRLLAMTIVMYLIGIGFLSSRAVSRGFRRNNVFVLIAAGLMSFVMLSQLWLENYMRWGFVSSGLVILVCLALFNVLTSSETPLRLLIPYVSASILVVLTTFPIMVGAVAGLTLGQVVSIWRGDLDRFRNKIISISSLVIPFATLFAFTPQLPFQIYIKNKLNVGGAITSVDARFTVFFVIAFAAMIMIGRDLVVKLAASGLALSLSTLVIDKYLDHVLTTTYYLQKFRWLSLFVICIIFCACLVSLFAQTKNTGLRVGIASLCALSVLLFVSPSLQKYSSNNLVRSMFTSWEYPTMQEARTIVETNAINPRSVLWQGSPNYLSTQIMYMWLMMGFEEIKDNSDLLLWTYNTDLFSLQTICEFALGNKPVTIWVQTPEVLKVVKPFCDDPNVYVHAFHRGL